MRSGTGATEIGASGPVSQGMAPVLPYERSEGNVDVIPAGQRLRFVNTIVDTIISSLVIFVAAIAIVVVIGAVWGEAGVQFYLGSQFFNSFLRFAYGILISLFYYIVLESLFGRTIGKLVTGTKVVNEFGGKASFGQILGRSFARMIPFEAFSFLGSTGRGWHDSLPKTYVIKCR